MELVGMLAMGGGSAAAAGGAAAGTGALLTAGGAAAGTAVSAAALPAVVSSGTAIAGLGTATAGAAAGGGSILGMLSTGTTLASTALSLFGGFSQGNAIESQAMARASSMQLQAHEMELQAEQEEIAGKQRSNEILDNMVQTLASQRLAYAGNGMDPSFGTPVSVAGSTRRQADLQLSVSRDDAQMKAMARRRSARARLIDAANIRASGSTSADAARMTGIAKSIGTVGDYAIGRSIRG